MTPIPTHLAENLGLRAEVSGGVFSSPAKEFAFRVYVVSSLPLTLSDVKLKASSDRFDASLAPSPAWHTYPELSAAGSNTVMQYFTLTLKSKSGIAEDASGVNLRLYAANQDQHFLAAEQTLDEAMDEHRVPCIPSLKMETEPQTQLWSNSLVLKNLLAFKKEGDCRVAYKLRPLGNACGNGGTYETEIHLAADDEDLYLLVATVGYAPPKGTELKINLAADRDGTSTVLGIDEGTFQVSSSPTVTGIKCVRRPPNLKTNGGSDVDIYQVQIPRKSVGLAKNYFYANFVRVFPVSTSATGKTEYFCWRGNDLTCNDPIIYGRFVLGK